MTSARSTTTEPRALEAEVRWRPASAKATARFDVPLLFKAADTGPCSRNNAIVTVEDAVAFYQSAQFLASPAAALALVLTADSIATIAQLSRTINALTTVAQIRKRLHYLARRAHLQEIGAAPLF